MKLNGLFSHWEDAETGCCVSYACVITTEHAASSYGQPVVVINGTAYGAGDLLGLGELQVPVRYALRIDGASYPVQVLSVANLRRYWAAGEPCEGPLGPARSIRY